MKIFDDTNYLRNILNQLKSNEHISKEKIETKDTYTLMREYICLAEELDRLKKEHDDKEERIKLLEEDISFCERELSHLKKHLDTTREYKNLRNLTFKQIALLFGIDTALIVSGRLSSDASIGLITTLVATPIITANIGKSNIEKYEKSNAYITDFNYYTTLEERYLKDKWELEQLEVEKEDLFNCYIAQLVLVTDKRRELAEASKDSSIKRIRKIEN